MFLSSLYFGWTCSFFTQLSEKLKFFLNVVS